MLPDERLQQIIKSKKNSDAVNSMDKHGHGSECWGIYDGILVIYDEEDMPPWFAKVREQADEDGNTPEFVAAHGD